MIQINKLWQALAVQAADFTGICGSVGVCTWPEELLTVRKYYDKRRYSFCFFL